MEDDEELCPVCESTCTCNHQPKDRGSARANGYRPKATYSGGKGNHHFPRRISPPPSPSNNDETSISGAPDSPTSSQPLRIRLKLAAPRPSTPPSSTRRKRSITYTSSSDSSSSSALNNKSRLPLAQTSAVSSLASHRVPPVNSSSHQGRPSNIQIQTSRSATPLASTSRAPSMSAGPSTLQTPTPKSRQPSSAWFLGVAPPGKSSASTSQLKGASRKPAGPGKALSQSYSRSNNVASRSSGGKGGHKIIGPSSKSTAASGTKVLSAGKSKAAMTKPPKAPINKSRGPTAPRKSSSPKKRRKIDYTPSPSPPLHGASSMDETSEDEYREYATVSRPKVHRPFAGPSRGRGGYVPTGLGRPVGVASLPTFMPKPLSSASESSDDDLDDAKALDVADIDDLDDDDDDDDIMKEEERMILKEERKKDKNKRKKKETGGGNHRQHQAKKETVKADNDIFMNSDLTSLSSSDSSSSSSSSASDSDSVASSGDEEDDEADAEADEDDDMADLGDEAAMWSDSTDEGDAALFFANFLSSDEHDDEEEEGKDKSSSNEMTEPQPLYASLLKGANNILDFEHGQHRRSRRRRKHSADVEDEQNFIVTEDHDGRLVFAADGWEGAEWAKADGLVLDDDEEVTSEESEIGGDPVLMEAANAEDDEESGVTTTESDFDGNTTFDEGLDEDGLPPSMAYLSQQHQEEQEYNLRRLRQEQAVDIPLPLPDHLRTGVELFQGGYATVMFGKFDFPAAAPSVMTSSGHLMPPEFAEVWEGIKDVESINEEETDEEEGMEMTSPVVQVKMEAQEGEAFVLETALSDAIGMGLELGMPSASDDQVPQVPQVPSPVDEIHSLPQEDHPPTPPRKMPVMGSFRRSPPSLDKAFVESSHPPAVIAPEHSLLVSPIVEKPPVNIFSAQPSVNNAGEPPASGDSTTSATPVPLPPKRMAIIDGKSTVPIPSPFAAVKKRRKSKIGSTEESDGSMSVGQRSDFFFSSHTGFGSWELGHGTKPRPSRSARSSFSQPFPPPLFPPLNLSGLDAIRTPLPGPFTPGAMPPPPPPLSAPIELADVLDSSFLNQGAVGDATCTTEDEDSSTLTRNLERWARVPMGTFRHSRAFGSIGNEAELAQLHGQPPETPRPVSDGFSYGATPTGPPIKSDSALWSDGIEPQLPAGSKGKGRASSKRRAPKLVLSPALLPIKDEEVPAEPDEMDVDLIPGIAEEEGYFSRKQYKGGREGTGRERLKRKFEEKERKSLGHGTGPKTPLQNRVKTPSSTPVSPQNDLPAKTN